MENNIRKLFRILIGIPCWIFLQSIGTIAFTLFGLAVIIGLAAGMGNLVAYIGTGDKEYLSESRACFEMLITIIGGTLVTYSWIQTGSFDMENLGLTHLEKKN